MTEQGDKLAVTLACVGVAIALVLYLVDKNRIVAIIVLIAFFAVMAYPVWHFVEDQWYRLACFALLASATLALGRYTWPKPVVNAPPMTASQKPKARENVEPITGPLIPIRKTGSSSSVKRQASDAGAEQIVNVDHGIGGIGGVYNNPVVNNYGPPDPVISWKPRPNLLSQTSELKAQTIIDITSDSIINSPSFALSCNRPCHATDLMLTPGFHTDRIKNISPTDIVVSYVGSSPLGPGVTASVFIESEDSLTVDVISVRRLK